MAAPTEVAPARELDVAALVAEARAAQERWPAAERPQLLRRAVQVMLAEQDAIVDTIRVETGKPLVEALTNELFVPWWFPYDDALASGFRGAFGVLYGRGLDRPRSAWSERRGLARVARRYAGRG